jgi:hypothetical protein
VAIDAATLQARIEELQEEIERIRQDANNHIVARNGAVLELQRLIEELTTPPPPPPAPEGKRYIG